MTVSPMPKASMRAALFAMAKPRLKPDDPEQSKRFIEMATEFEADSSVDQFDRAFRKVSTAPRTPKPPKRAQAKPAKKGK